MAEYTEETARKLLERAVGMTGKPVLATADIDLLLELAVSDGVYTSQALNRAASTGWDWKSALTADQYDLGGGSGKYLTRNQWFQQCMAMSEAYRNGSKTVDGIPGTNRPRGFGVIAITGQQPEEV